MSASPFQTIPEFICLSLDLDLGLCAYFKARIVGLRYYRTQYLFPLLALGFPMRYKELSNTLPFDLCSESATFTIAHLVYGPVNAHCASNADDLTSMVSSLQKTMVIGPISVCSEKGMSARFSSKGSLSSLKLERLGAMSIYNSTCVLQRSSTPSFQKRSISSPKPLSHIHRIYLQNLITAHCRS